MGETSPSDPFALILRAESELERVARSLGAGAPERVPLTRETTRRSLATLLEDAADRVALTRDLADFLHAMGLLPAPSILASLGARLVGRESLYPASELRRSLDHLERAGAGLLRNDTATRAPLFVPVSAIAAGFDVSQAAFVKWDRSGYPPVERVKGKKGGAANGVDLWLALPWIESQRARGCRFDLRRFQGALSPDQAEAVTRALKSNISNFSNRREVDSLIADGDDIEA